MDFKELRYPSLGTAQGVVVVRVKLDNQGKVVNAEALSGAPLLVQPSVVNAKTWRFKPNSQKAAIVVYNFRVKGVCFSANWSSQMILYPPNFAVITACSHPPVP